MVFEYECELCGQAFDSEEELEPAVLCGDCLPEEQEEENT